MAWLEVGAVQTNIITKLRGVARNHIGSSLVLPAPDFVPPTQPSGHAACCVDTTAACTSGSLIAVRLESESIAKSIPHLPHGESVHCPLLTVIASVQYLLVVDVTISHWHAQEWPSDRTNVISDYGSWFPDWASTSSSSLHVASTTVHLEGLT